VGIWATDTIEKVNFISQVSLIRPPKSYRFDLFTDIVIRWTSDSDNIIPDGACIFFEVFVDGNSVKKTGQFLKKLAESSWRLNETIHV
jgi:hypothetical protein